jgi:hypothetical protein
MYLVLLNLGFLDHDVLLLSAEPFNFNFNSALLVYSESLASELWQLLWLGS